MLPKAPAPAPADDDWRGAGIMAGGKGYAPTPMGQVHYRDIGHWAVYHYDMEPDARAIRAPTLILTDAHDMIHERDERHVKLRPDFKYEVFSEYTALGRHGESVRRSL